MIFSFPLDQELEYQRVKAASEAKIVYPIDKEVSVMFIPVGERCFSFKEVLQ